MKTYEIDTAKMPLGKLSKAQIQKGFDILTSVCGEHTHSADGELNAPEQRCEAPGPLCSLLLRVDACYCCSEIDDAIKGHKSSSKLNELSSRFYSLIPHDFGRRAPSAISSSEQLKNKQDLLNVLNDIEIAQDLQAKAKTKAKQEAEAEVDLEALPRNPIDEVGTSLTHSKRTRPQQDRAASRHVRRALCSHICAAASVSAPRHFFLCAFC